MTHPPEPSLQAATANPRCRLWWLAQFGAMRTESYGDPAMEELAAARDSDELCRLLVQLPWGWGSSTRHAEAVSLFRGLRGGTFPGSLVALLLCTCRRWDRVTAKLIAAVGECGVLSGPDLDELAESLLSDEVVVVFPLVWMSGQWLELGTADGTTRRVQVSDEAVARDERRVQPPLRRWAAARALRNDPARLEELLARADGMSPRHRDALLNGLLDAGRLVLMCGAATDGVRGRPALGQRGGWGSIPGPADHESAHCTRLAVSWACRLRRRTGRPGGAKRRCGQESLPPLCRDRLAPRY